MAFKLKGFLLPIDSLKCLVQTFCCLTPDCSTQLHSTDLRKPTRFLARCIFPTSTDKKTIASEAKATCTYNESILNESDMEAHLHVVAFVSSLSSLVVYSGVFF